MIVEEKAKKKERPVKCKDCVGCRMCLRTGVGAPLTLSEVRRIHGEYAAQRSPLAQA